MISRIILSIINFFKFFDSSFSIKNKSQKEANKIQLNLLKKLISKSKHTKFGVDHNFENIKTPLFSFPCITNYSIFTVRDKKAKHILSLIYIFP